MFVGLNITPELFARVLGHTLCENDSGRIDSLWVCLFLCSRLLICKRAESLLVELTVVVMNSLIVVLLAVPTFLRIHVEEILSVVEAGIYKATTAAATQPSGYLLNG